MVQIKRRALRIALHLQQPDRLPPSSSSSSSPFLLTAPFVSAKLGDTIGALYGIEGLASFSAVDVVFIERNSVTTRFIVRCPRSFLPSMRTAIAAIRSIQDCPVAAAIEHVSGGWEGKRELSKTA
ncbi:hypothetical protein CLOM_g6174 [Closterium sp. NIES-68]|nr:hypothetical protein CLOM_g6174 [Closterium sp. NIES-68]GJP59900.1 hypothetical protein CLOP_g15747 [Closterium sp. NIES-67]